MGKKNRKKKGKIVSASGKPFVSICTPTYNRRKFIPFLIKCFKSQTYPPHTVEMIDTNHAQVNIVPKITGNNVVMRPFIPPFITGTAVATGIDLPGGQHLTPLDNPINPPLSVLITILRNA